MSLLDELEALADTHLYGEALSRIKVFVAQQRVRTKQRFDAPAADRIVEERQRQYGDTSTNMATLALAWTAILRQHYQLPELPVMSAHVADWMQLTMKMLRACTPSPHHQDNYLDAYNYMRFAEADSLRAEHARADASPARMAGPAVGGGGGASVESQASTAPCRRSSEDADCGDRCTPGPHGHRPAATTGPSGPEAQGC